MLKLIEAVRGRLFGPKTWDRSVKILKLKWMARDCVGGCFWVLFHKLCIKLCMRSGLPVDSPLALFWDCKNSPGFV